ncbi:hypothetical protein PC128_g21277 [Phytophthora cactorum]|nr:hypothetical protein PC120_g19384 [Phytophthora cactorum]KAG3138449.1 hypothetical protein C6341_g20660 [Phytophthora cactorum]KAG3159529.1 hypothetical protein PC128_g21277 [Phytophthora cactorum]KAG4044609.1 hypothetical protein PC123_g19952 [Phytophthora cactorum]
MGCCVESGSAVLRERSVANLPSCGQAVAAGETAAKDGVVCLVCSTRSTNENELRERVRRATGVAANGGSSVPSSGGELGTKEVDEYEENEYELDEGKDVARSQ